MPQVHRLVVQLAARGVDAPEISRITGIPVEAVKVILRSPLAQAEIAREVLVAS
jgi:hypothetical protein